MVMFLTSLIPQLHSGVLTTTKGLIKVILSVVYACIQELLHCSSFLVCSHRDTFIQLYLLFSGVSIDCDDDACHPIFWEFTYLLRRMYFLQIKNWT